MPSSVTGLNRGGVSASSGARREGSGDFGCVGLNRFGCVSTGIGGGIGDGVATGVFVDDEDGSIASDGVVGGAMMRLDSLPYDHCRLLGKRGHQRCDNQKRAF